MSFRVSEIMSSWLKVQVFDKRAFDLFEESIKCFNAMAFRAAVVFAYVAMLAVIRRRLEESATPSGYSDAEWNAKIVEIGDDEKWEEIVFTFINTSSDKAKSIFVLKDNEREDFRYWRRRRNECAHAKERTSEPADSALVETLWSFIRANLPKLKLRGATEGLLNDIRTAMDPARTPAAQEYGQLVSRIPHSVSVKDQSVFFNDLGQVLLASFLDQDEFKKRGASLISELLLHEDKDIADSTYRILNRHHSILVASICAKPQILRYNGFTPEFLRELWYSSLWGKRGAEQAFLWMLHYGLVPNSQRREAVKAYLKSGFANGPRTPEGWQLLDDAGFFEEVQNQAIHEHGVSSFEWARNNSRALVALLDYKPIAKQTAIGLFHAFDTENHSYAAKAAIRSLFATNSAKYEEFVAVLAQEGLPPPRFLRVKLVSGDDEEREELLEE